MESGNSVNAEVITVRIILDITAITIQFLLVIQTIQKLLNQERESIKEILYGFFASFIFAVTIESFVYFGLFSALAFALLLIFFIICVFWSLRVESILGLFISLFTISLFVLSFCLSTVIIGIITHISYVQMLLNLTVEHYVLLILWGLFFFYASRMILKYKTSQAKLTYREIIFLICIPTVSMISIFALLDMMQPLILENRKIISAVIVATCIAATDFLSYYFYISLAKQYEKDLKTAIIKQQNEILLSNANEMMRYYEGARKIYHDFRQYLIVALSYMEEHEEEKAIDYLKQILSLQEGIIQHRIVCDNHIVNYVLNYIAGKCQSAGVDCVFTITVSLSQIKEADFCIVLCNLLDNALEASIQEEYAKIQVIMQMLDEEEHQKDIQVIIKNKISRSILLNNPELKSTKKDLKNHGFGIHNARDILKSMNGELDFYEEDGFFCSMIVIRMSEEVIADE